VSRGRDDTQLTGVEMEFVAEPGLQVLTRRSALLGSVWLATSLESSSSSCAPAPALATEIRLLAADDSAVTNEIIRALTSRMPSAVVGQDVRTLIDRKGAGVYAAIGPRALQELVEVDVAAPTLSLFASNEAYTRIRAASRSERRRETLTAIYAEASPQQQMRLIRELYKRRLLVGIMLTAATAHMQSLLEQAARSNDLALQVKVLDIDEQPLHAMSKMAECRVLLMVPDRNLYTPDNLRYILESAYRRGQGVIGFSGELVRAGTVAAAYASIDDIAAQAAKVLADLAGGRVVGEQYPEYWRVQINDRVARSLNLVVEDAAFSLGNAAPSP
jgi:putative ABC transport system substrate-binding protein